MDFEKGRLIHKKLFPKATVYSQISQLNEEIKEYNDAEKKEDFEEELGDILNVAVSLLDFKETEYIGEYILHKEYFSKGVSEQKKRMKLYEKAIEKCKQRVSDARYKFVNGVYKRDKNFKKG